ncbi:MAG: ABC transporter permease [Chitinophagaceae bacterium]|nr:ABC transporter permease [Chitinophagaceae bacterium]
MLTKSAAKALFGNEEPINKTVRLDLDGGTDMKVTGVVEDVPGNSTFQFDYIIPFNYSNESLKTAMAQWRNSSWNVFIQTQEGANMISFDKLINNIQHQHFPEDRSISTYFTFPMDKWRLESEFKNGRVSGGMIEYVRLFSIIAVIILLIACVNFMNLSTARSEKRAKEVGIRKTLGSGKSQLIFQFFLESIILSTIAFVVSIVAVYLLLPAFNSLVDKNLSISVSQPNSWLVAVVLIIFTGIVAGSYPALYLSSFKPVKVLKGIVVSGKETVLPRHILVVGQFAISILLISSTIVIYRQIQHVKNRDLGYNPDNLIMIPASTDTRKNFSAIKDELIKSGLVRSMTQSFSPITEVWSKSPAPDWSGKPAGSVLTVNNMRADVDYTKTMGVKIIEGRDFSGMPSDSSAVLLNEAAVRAMDLKKPVGTKLRGGNREFTIIGVTANIVMESPYEPVAPMLIWFNPARSNTISIRLAATVKPQDALKSIEAIFKKHNPLIPFEYKFVDEEFSRKFLTEAVIGKITSIFAGLAIFICCIGLAGLASYTIEKRIREIGIRKVLGASVQQLLMLISKDFLKLVLIAFAVSAPLASWFMNNWLEKYPYRTSTSFWLFAGVGLATILLALIVIALNTIKAAIANPVKSLRTE